MDNKVINLFNDKNFVSYPYLQSKKTYETINWDNREIDKPTNSLNPYTENPFSVYYKTEN